MEIFQINSHFKIQSGYIYPSIHLGYHTWGSLNETGTNVVWIFHALTADSNAAVWWSGLVGQGKLFCPTKYFIICVNMPNSCYGSIGPLSINCETQLPYYKSFSFFTIADMIAAYKHLQVALGIRKIHVGIGGSMGGQQLLQWAVSEPDLFEYIVPIACNAVHSPWGKAFNASQRMAIQADATWQLNTESAGKDGLTVARSIAMLSYRHHLCYNSKQHDDDANRLTQYKSDSYQQYQGRKLANRFNAFSYYALTQAMDAHHVGRGKSGVVEALQTIKSKTLVIGIDTDLLFPLFEQQYLVNHITNAELGVIKSDYGHDAFLVEYSQLQNLISTFLKQS